MIAQSAKIEITSVCIGPNFPSSLGQGFGFEDTFMSTGSGSSKLHRSSLTVISHEVLKDETQKRRCGGGSFII